MTIITKYFDGLYLVLDDIIVFGLIKAKHDKRLEALCQRLHD